MNHKVLRIFQSLHNKPQLIEPQTFDTLLSYLDLRNKVGLDANMPESFGEEQKQEEQDEGENDGTVFINIFGSLKYRKDAFDSMCGVVSYQSLMEDVEEAIENGAENIVMVIDSGGGEAYSCFTCANDIRSMCDNAGVKLYAYVDGMAASAAYALACMADEVIANPMAEVGSIGVVVSLLDTAEYMKNEGLKRIFITDGDSKVPFDADGHFKKEFIDDLQLSVKKMGDMFREYVSSHTGISVEDLEATQAKVYDAETALSMGLINKIMTQSEFIKYVEGNEKDEGLI